MLCGPSAYVKQFQSLLLEDLVGTEGVMRVILVSFSVGSLNIARICLILIFLQLLVIGCVCSHCINMKLVQPRI